MTSNTKTLTHFSEIPNAEIQRSTFDRSSGVKKTFNAGELIPIFVDEVIPGDIHKLKDHIFGRLATPITPFMDNLYLDTHYFFVPMRLIWENWERFNGAQDNPGDSTDFILPSMESPVGGYDHLSIFDNFGIPPKIGGLEHTSLPLRAYNLIYNEWYRDENLQDSTIVHKGDSADPATDYIIKRRGKRKDYFTSAQTSPQKGPAVSLPLGGSAPVYGTAVGEVTRKSNGAAVKVYKAGDNLYPTTDTGEFQVGGTGSLTLVHGAGPTYEQVSLDPNGSLQATIHGSGNTLYASLADATAATINSLRLAFQVQRMYEKDQRGGTRYIEILRAHFNVTSPDFRLQRPEYLGGNTKRITSSVVPQTSSTDATTPQANLAAYSTVASSGSGFQQSFVEHGYIIGIASLRADLNYQQGLNRMWSRKTRFDFYWPTLSHLGEQTVLNKEIYAQGTSADEQVFGFQERYAEYRYKPNEIHGAFRSSYPQTLDMWHLAQKFTSLPALNNTFIQEDPPVDRIIAVTNEPHIICDFHFELESTRPMPVYSVPGLVDHF